MTLWPPLATSTLSWRKVDGSGIGTPRSSTTGAPCSPWTQEQELVCTDVLSHDLQPLLCCGNPIAQPDGPSAT